MDFLISPFEFSFFKRAFIAITLSSINCGLIGVFVILQRMTFMGGALSHAILPGVVLAYIKKIQLFWGALFASLLTSIGVSIFTKNKIVKEDTAIGVMLSVMFALGILFMSLSDSFRNFESILMGSLFSVQNYDLKLIAAVTLIVVTLLFFFFKEIELAAVDRDYSRSIGIYPGRLKALLLVLISMSVVSSIYIMGALLATALLIIPAATARMIFKSTPQIMTSSIGLSMFSGISGLYLSYYQDISPGAAIVLISGTLFAFSWAYNTHWYDYFKRSSST